MDAVFTRYDDAVQAIYTAVTDPQRWPRVLASVAALFDGYAALLFTPMHGPHQGGFVFTHNISAATIEHWSSKSIDDDIYVQQVIARGLLIDGTAFNGDDFIPRDQLLASAFFNELWKPAGLSHSCVGVIFGGTDSHQLPTAVTIFRTFDDPPFTAEHVALLQRLVIHLSRALGLMFHLRDKELQIASSFAALDRLSSAVVLLDTQQRITFTNAASQHLLSKASLISLTDGAPQRLQLHPALHSQQPAFQRLLARAVHSPDNEVDHFSNALVLQLPDGRPAGVVHAVSLGPLPGLYAGGPHACVIVLIYAMDDMPEVRPELLSQLFGLTAGEARAALQVLLGGAAADMAGRMGVSVNTFKTHFRLAYEKMNVRRQTDLLKLLLSLASS